MNPEARAPTMLPVRVIWPGLNYATMRWLVIGGITLMSRDELASLGVDRTISDHADHFCNVNYACDWTLLPAALRRRVLQFAFGEDSKIRVRS